MFVCSLWAVWRLLIFVKSCNVYWATLILHIAGKGYASSTMASLDLQGGFWIQWFHPPLRRIFQSQKPHPLGSAKVFFHSLSSGANRIIRRYSLKMSWTALQIAGGWHYRLLPQAAQEATVEAMMNNMSLKNRLPAGHTEGLAKSWMPFLLLLCLAHIIWTQFTWDHSQCLSCRMLQTRLLCLLLEISAWRTSKTQILVTPREKCMKS
jgi:hypothetical protein